MFSKENHEWEQVQQFAEYLPKFLGSERLAGYIINHDRYRMSVGELMEALQVLRREFWLQQNEIRQLQHRLGECPCSECKPDL